MSGELDDQSEQQQQQQQRQQEATTTSCPSSPGSGPSSAPDGSSSVDPSGGAAAATTTTSAQEAMNDSTAAAGAAGSSPGAVVVTDSVVPSLMQVYESMTQSRLDGLGGGSISGGGGTSLQQQYFVQQQQQQQQQLYHHPLPPPVPLSSAAAVAANNAALYSSSSNVQLHQQQQQQHMQLGAVAAGFPLPPIPDPSFLAAIHGSSHSTGTAAAPKPSPRLASMSDEPSLRKKGDEAISSTESTSSSVGGGEGGGGRNHKTRKRSLPAKDDEVTSTTSSTTGGGRGSTNKARRKGKGNSKDLADGRWSKRFSWPEELHRDFVAAIFDVGLKHSSPSTILEHMPKHEQINNERVKSHLQKYRINRAKSKEEFMSSYEASLDRLKKKKLLHPHQGGGGDAVGSTLKVLSGAEVAGHLTYTSTNATADPADTSPDSVDSAAMGVAVQQQQHPVSHGTTLALASAVVGVGVPQEDVFIFPRLNQAEKQSPIGASVGYLMGLFFSLKHQLMVQREAQQQQQLQESAQLPTTSLGGAAVADDPNHPAAAVFHSFVGRHPASRTGAAAATNAVAPPPTSSSSTATMGHQTPTVIHIPSPNNGSGASTVPPAAAVPSTRTNLEENNIMKREMQNQMAVQNKMRALKQQELSKYRSASVSSTTMNTASGPGSADDAYREEPNYSTIPAPAHNTALPNSMNFNRDHHLRSTSDDLTSMRMAPPPGTSSAPPMTSLAAQNQQQQQYNQEQQQQQQQYQGAGENEVDDPGGESASGNPLQVDDFWQHDMVDDQLFRFLMSDG